MGSGYEIARAIEQLISDGHPPELAWSYTPRQLAAWTDLGYRRRCGEEAQLLASLATSRASERAIKERIKKLSDESA